MKADSQSKEKFTEIYNTHFDAIFRVSFFRINDKDMALDLTQQTFANVWEYYERGEIIDNPKALAYRINRNLIIDWYRKKKPESLDKLFNDGFDANDKLHEDDIEHNAEFEHTLHVLKQLTPEERKFIHMRFMKDFSLAEIAKITHEKINIISVKIHRAMLHLKKLVCHEDKTGKDQNR